MNRVVCLGRLLTWGMIAFAPACGSAENEPDPSQGSDGSGNVSPWPDGAVVPDDTGAAVDGSTITPPDSTIPPPDGAISDGGSTDGAARNCGAWSACTNADVCAESGIQTRSCTTCDGGACDGQTVMQMQACTRTTAGVSCGARACPAWPACTGFADTCDTTGTQSRSCTDKVCEAGKCADKAATEMQDCTRSTGGVTCAPTTCPAFGACSYGTCSTSGTKRRTCTGHDCSNGTCGSYSIPESAGCTRTLACSSGQSQNCTVERTSGCPSGCGPPCYHSGTQSCNGDCTGWNECTIGAGGWLCP